MPIQGRQSKDDLLLHLNDKKLNPNGPNPEVEDRVILLRHRVSRIFFLSRFFDYPISLSKSTLKNMGFIRTIKAGLGYFLAIIHKKEENSLENFYINRFGKSLYKLFFENYTEKVWGIHPSKLGADWGSQRVKGLSFTAILKDMFLKKMGKKQESNTETSLIEQFIYPKYGPGQLWELVAKEIENEGGEILIGAEVIGIHLKNNKVISVDCRVTNNTIKNMECDYLLSTMPIKDLINAIKDIAIPNEIQQIASELPYRDFITVGLCLKKLIITNQTNIKTYQNRIPDTWIYIQEKDVKIGRLQIFNNWSPYLVNDYENTMWIGLEYFCTEGDELWNMEKDKFIDMAIEELVKIKIINREDVLDSCQIKIKKAYPAYYGSYYQLKKVKDFLNGIENLFCLGRNGQHRYNNMDHSMMTAMECVENIRTGNNSKENIWSVNTEEEYHETK